MSCEIVFLAVGNADSIIICPDNDPCVLVDLGKPRAAINWLAQHNKSQIAALYFTHAHSDHFVGLIDFVTFFKEWIGNGRTLDKVFLSNHILDDALDKLEEAESKNPVRYLKLQAALDELQSLNKEVTKVSEIDSGNNPSYSLGELVINVLHPRALFAATHRRRKPKAYNERSLVLRVNYGEFVAVLLADLEGEGVVDILNAFSANPGYLTAHVIKIPHHGAWETPSDKLEELLEIIDAELAVLSVGSTNQYGHVASGLFRKLIDMVTNSSFRLQKFICTEATRTCAKSLSERSTMGKAGLRQRLPCAGDIVVSAEASGKWAWTTQNDHDATIAGLKHAACDNRADL